MNKKLYRFCFLRWKSCTFARFKIWQCTGEVFPHRVIFLCAPEMSILFGDTVGASLVRGTWLPPPGCYDATVAKFQQHDARKYLSGARIQNAESSVLDPCAKEMYFKRSPKVDPLRIEGGLSWRVCFWPLYLSDMLKLCRLPCAQNLSFRGGNLELGRPVFASLVFLVFLGPKTRPFFVTGRSKSRPTPPWTPDLAQVHVTDPASPHCHPRKQRSKCKFLQSEDIFVKQLVAVRRVCVCAAAKNDYLTLQNHCVDGTIISLLL